MRIRLALLTVLSFGPKAASAQTVAPPAAPVPEETAEMTDEERKLFELALEGEVIEIWAERSRKPFDRDTELRLTGPELARRGISNLSEALQLIPEINARNVNRGGTQIDIRGARKGSVKILIDGIPVADPYRGNFDVSAIPVTDIVEIRISTSPASPIDGTGGPGGVVEIHTRDAIGPKWLGIRLDANTLPQTLSAASASTMLSDFTAARVSITGNLGASDFPVTLPDGSFGSLSEDKRSVSTAVRFEYRQNTQRFLADFGFGTGSYLVPPSETDTRQVVDVDSANDARFGLSAEDELGDFRVQLRGYGGITARKTNFFPDADLREATSSERVNANNAGVAFLANRPIGELFQVVTSVNVDSESGDVTQNQNNVQGRSTLSALAAGFLFEQKAFRLDGSVGIAIPLGTGASPWPEAKLSTKVSPFRILTVRVVGGYKGRLPTLRERFDATGNEALGPEKALFGEIGFAIERNDYVSFDLGGYVRRANGMIRFDGDAGMLVNVGELTMHGFDAKTTVMPYSLLNGGASVSYVKATSGDFGDDAVDRLPRWRSDIWTGVNSQGKWGGVVRFRYTGAMVDQGITLDDYGLIDVSSFFRVTASIQLSARIDNMVDNRYEDRAGGVFGTGRVFLLSAQGTWE